MNKVRIAHVALWTADLERLASFYRDFFGAKVGACYESRRRPGFRSRFLTLAAGPAIELMQAPWLGRPHAPHAEHVGYAHIALSLGKVDAVDRLAAKAKSAGFLVASPRTTGDGFYEAIMADPDGNLIEMTT